MIFSFPLNVHDSDCFAAGIGRVHIVADFPIPSLQSATLLAIKADKSSRESLSRELTRNGIQFDVVARALVFGTWTH